MTANKSVKTPVKKRRYPVMHCGKATICTLFVLFTDMAVLYLLTSANQFANLNRELFLKGNCAAFIALAVVNVVTMLCILVHRKAFYMVWMFLLTLLTAGAGYGLYAYGSIEQSLENLTRTTIQDDVNITLLYNTKASEAVILEEGDLDGRTIAVPAETQLAEAVKARMYEQDIHAEFVECTSYVEEARMLITGEADCAAMPRSWQSILSDEEAIAEHLEEFTVLSEFNTHTTTVNAEGADKDLTTEPFTVLLEGDSDGLSDTIIIVSVNPKSMEITMTSIARDSYVPITCIGNQSSKINAAHMYGGMGCMMDTVTQLTGLTFDYYVEVNFQGIVSIVDALGGIQVTNYTDFVGQTYTDEKSFHFVDMPKGKDVTLNGEQALAWIRERKAFIDGDFARQRHQQEFLKIVLEKVMQTRDINTLLRLLEAAGDNLKTNMKVDQLTNFLNYANTKARRYYNQGSVSGVLNITNWRVNGYDDTKWHDGLQMNLYIFRVYPSSLSNTYSRVYANLTDEENLEVPEDVSWDGEEGYTPPAIY